MKTTEQKNILIADFMDVPTESTIVNFAQPDGHTRAKTVTAYQIEPKRTDGFSNLTFDFQLKYHTSWDWLMPVVDKIYSTGLDEHDANEIGDITHALLDVNIDAVHEAVVQFIEWYNEKK